ncbi:hypothetical protein BH20ACI3_BH20ACI3_22340 [soil metagenome]
MHVSHTYRKEPTRQSLRSNISVVGKPEAFRKGCGRAANPRQGR